MKKNNSKFLYEVFQKDGYIFIKNFLNIDEFDQIKHNLFALIRDVAPSMPPEQAFYEERGNSAALKQITDVSNCNSSFHNLLHKGKFKELAEVLLGEQVDGKNLAYFNKPPKIGKSTPPHQDGYYFMLKPNQALTMWLPLEKVDKDNGCLHYIKGSHLQGIRPHGKSETLGFSQGITDYTKEDFNREVIIEAEPGDLVVHHALTIHRADGNKSIRRTRMAMGFIYYGVSAVQDIERQEAYQKVLRDEIRAKS